MVRIFRVVNAVIASAVLLSGQSCRKEIKETFYCHLEDNGVGVTEISFASEPAKRQYHVSCNGNWSVAVDGSLNEWIGIEPQEGSGDGEVSISVSENDSPDERTAELCFRMGEGVEITRIKVSQRGSGAYLEVDGNHFGVSEQGAEVILDVETNLPDWDYTVVDADWLEEKERTDNRLVLSVTGELSMHEDRMAKIRFYSDGYPDFAEEVEVVYRRALMLDIVFNDDGSASDASSYGIPVTVYPGAGLVTYMNGFCGHNVARFNNTPGATVSSGYYKANYSVSTDFVSGLSDGHTVEAMFMLDTEAAGKGEIKMFSSHQSGGTGFLVTAQDRGNQIAFLPDVNSQYVWTLSGIVPERGRYYHVVGVWDRKAGKSRIYVDGELKAEVPAAGSLTFPSSVGYYWFGVGADAGNSGESAWKGDVVLARVYDAVLDDSQIGDLWKAADCGFPVSDIRLDNVLFMTGCKIAAHSEYRILGDGFADGDIVRWISADGTAVFETEGHLGTGMLSVQLPDNAVSGTYKLMLLRGESVCPIGTAELDITDVPVSMKKPKVVAHRCFHKNGVPENSLAALRGAQELGVYGAEIDVWITLDGKLVVNHDGVLGGKTLQNCTYDEVKDLKLSNGESLPTFEAMLEQAALSESTKLIIEIKDHNEKDQENKAVDEVLRVVREKGMDTNVEYIAFDYDLCKRIVSARPDAVVGYLMGDKSPEEVFADGVKSIDYPFSVLKSKPEWVVAAQDMGMVVNVWTVNSDQDLMSAIAFGADYITTDNPDRLKEISERLFP